MQSHICNIYQISLSPTLNFFVQKWSPSRSLPQAEDTHMWDQKGFPTCYIPRASLHCEFSHVPMAWVTTEVSHSHLWYIFSPIWTLLWAVRLEFLLKLFHSHSIGRASPQYGFSCVPWDGTAVTAPIVSPQPGSLLLVKAFLQSQHSYSLSQVCVPSGVWQLELDLKNFPHWLILLQFPYSMSSQVCPKGWSFPILKTVIWFLTSMILSIDFKGWRVTTFFTFIAFLSCVISLGEKNVHFFWCLFHIEYIHGVSLQVELMPVS